MPMRDAELVGAVRHGTGHVHCMLTCVCARCGLGRVRVSPLTQCPMLTLLSTSATPHQNLAHCTHVPTLANRYPRLWH
jgi:hypothetical protein